MRGVTILDRDERGVLMVQPRDIAAIAGRAAKDSEWLVSGVECLGGSEADECHHLSDSNERIPGDYFLRLVAALEQVIDGEFAAYQTGEPKPWLIIRVVDSSALDVETEDSELLERIRQRFNSVSEIPT